ncbi:hypothetical protein P8935_21380 [Telmatobacter sp. DSM 110680]|uniref:Uncharacterized protein n=1 Tax=Telmatobacter sp. DSM 110680 TaxID=3036704 RepID=A0AAU7DIE0_9BACT
MNRQIDLCFPHQWQAQILPRRPVILPRRHFVYPKEVEEIERGALEVLIRPDGTNGESFLATCAVGFLDPAVPTGIWSAPNPREICTVSGGYAYIIDTGAPERFSMVPYRPVLQVYAVVEHDLLLFVEHRAILAWGAQGEAWQTPKLSDEGVTITSIEGAFLHGMGWHMMADKEKPFTLDLRSGSLIDM